MAGMSARLLSALLVSLVLASGCGDPEPAPADAGPDPRQEALRQRLEATPPGPERVELEIQSATLHLMGSRNSAEWQGRLASTVEALQGLRDRYGAAGDADAEARIRIALGKHLSMAKRHDEAEAELDWVLENAAGTPHAPGALTEKANVRYRQEDFAGCKALLERVIAEFPDSREAQSAPRGIAGCDRQLEATRDEL
jgi:TolA-binding protein